jgi:hypothetical protein
MGDSAVDQLRPGRRLDDFDRVYFAPTSWDERLSTWFEEWHDQEFADGNGEVVRQAICDVEAGLRVVVNIGVRALLKLFADGRYLNLYERPEIGGERKTPSAERVAVDTALDLDGPHVYFGAVALGGAGVRFYGEYCLVLDLVDVDNDPQLFDRDSYDILLEPIADLESPQQLIDRLVGSWEQDVHAMVMLKVLPELVHQRRLVTTGTVSELVLKDQEFIEVHLQPDQDGFAPRSFGPSDLEEVRESPDEVAVASRLREKEEEGHRLLKVEYEWLLRREAVSRALARAALPTRVVTQHGRGYQWK